MKHLRYILSLLLCLAGGVMAMADNVVSMPDSLQGQAGKTVTVPITVTNDEEIVAAQFNVHLPFAKAQSLNPTLDKNRNANGHSIDIKSLGNNTYTIVIVNMANKAIAGNDGVLVNFPMTIRSNEEPGASYEMKITDVVLTNRKGRNIATNLSGSKGTFTIQSAPSADFEVTDVEFLQWTELMPRQSVCVRWKVTNVGGTENRAGWTESVYLVNAETEKEYYIGKTQGTATLVAGASVTNQLTVDVPEAIGTDGTVRAKVVLTPNSDAGEYLADRGNNTAVSTGTAQLGKLLYLTASPAVLQEGKNVPVRCTLKRSGDRSVDETFTLTSDGPFHFIMPETVTIPAGQSAVVFNVYVEDNSVVNDYNQQKINVTCDYDYDRVNLAIQVEDDEMIPLSMAFSSSDITEGETITLNIQSAHASAIDREIFLSCEMPKRFDMPSSVIMPAGQTKLQVSITARDDDNADLDYTVAFFAQGEIYGKTERLVMLHDNDVPDIEMTLTPTTVKESAGLRAFRGEIRRTSNVNSIVTIKFSDDSKNHDIIFNYPTITLNKGTEKATFDIGVRDNGVMDGEREVNITAAVYSSNCSCTVGAQKATVTQKVTIIDDDGPSLTLTCDRSSIFEGSSTEATFTVKRNDSPDADLTVNIACNDSRFILPASVVIPKGQTSVTFKGTTKSNDVQNDSRTSTITVTSGQYAKGVAYVQISDQTLPDAIITDFAVSGTTFVAGSGISAKITVSNQGVADLPENTKVYFYCTAWDEPFIVPLGTRLAPGGVCVLPVGKSLPAKVGKFETYACVNNNSSINELIYTNNYSDRYPVTLTAPYKATATVEKLVYAPDESIVIKGQLTPNIANGNVSQVPVEVYVINNNTRKAMTATTDVDGSYAIAYHPESSQVGHFIVGACYPTANLSEEMGSFDIYGLRRQSSTLVKCEVTVGTEYEGNLLITNPNSLPLTNIKVEMIDEADDCVMKFDKIILLEAGETAPLRYTINATKGTGGQDWKKMRLQLTSDEGATFTMPLYYYCFVPTGQLDVSIKSIKTTMIKGQSRDFSFTITNTGKGETGRISLSIPQVATWMRSVTPLNMGSLASGESTDIILRLTPGQEQELNLAQVGNIAINCDNADGVSISYSIQTVSSAIGKLIIEPKNDYANADGTPALISGAKVEVCHPITGAVITEGYSDESGRFTCELPEGNYRLHVTADKHDTYDGNIIVDPGTDNVISPELRFEAVSVTWVVKETEIEDVYNIETVVTYETRVPKPVLEVVLPDQFPLQEVKENGSAIIHAVITNKGWIQAEDVHCVLNDVDNVVIEYPMEQGFTLAPGVSMVFPIKVSRADWYNSSARERFNVRRKAESDDDDDFDVQQCITNALIDFVFACAGDEKKDMINLALKIKECASHGGGYGLGFNPAAAAAYADALSKIFPAKKSTSSGKTPHFEMPEDKDCDQCAQGIKACIAKGYNCARNNAVPDIKTGGKTVVKKVKNAAENAKAAKDWAESTCEKCEEPACEGRLGGGPAGAPTGGGVSGGGHARARAASFGASEGGLLPSYIRKFYYINNLYQLYGNTSSQYVKEIFGGDALLKADGDELLNFEPYLSKWINSLDSENTDETISADDLFKFCPSNVTRDKFDALLERLANYANGNTSAANHPDMEKLAKYEALIDSIDRYAFNEGYESMPQYFTDAYQEYLQASLAAKSSNVCATVQLRFNQTMTMTRQAFLGTLTVTNGQATSAMKDVQLNLVISTENGQVATKHEMQQNLTSLTGFAGENSLDASWTLNAGETGVAEITFIPTRYAAPEEETVWYFGGTLTYTNEADGGRVIRELYPVPMTVKPSPVLDLTYFMQRDILGDNPLTANVVEPMVPAEFALLINNKGEGAANNVSIMTPQPEIKDGGKGLLIDFELLSSSVNGKDKTLALGGSVPADFGTIPAHKQSYAQWELQSTLLGHFIDYNVTATHVTSYDNPDLSLLDEVTIHELVHSLRFPSESGDSIVGWLVNDIEDSYDRPDMLYMSNNEVYTVNANDPENAKWIKISNTEHTLQLTPVKAGWNYIKVADPSAGSSSILRVTRKSDGKEISLRNMWQTQWTLIDGGDPIKEYSIHLCDSMGLDGESYDVLFCPFPDVRLAVADITGPSRKENIETEPVRTVNVTFNKEILPETFTYEDLNMRLQGTKVDMSKVTISTEDNINFSLDMSNTTVGDGYYVLEVQTAGIKDNEDFFGANGKSIDWVHYLGGLVKFGANVWPVNSGKIYYFYPDKKEGQARRRAGAEGSGSVAVELEYNGLIELRAEANPGFEFIGWYNGNDLVSESATYTTNAIEHTTLKARFAQSTFQVKVACDTEFANLAGACDGMYHFGDVLTLKVQPKLGMPFSGWLVNGDIVATTTTAYVTVDKDLEITALFDAEKYSRTLAEDELTTICLPKGINEGNYAGAVLYEVLGTVLANDGSVSGVVLGSVKNTVAGVPYFLRGTSSDFVAYLSGSAVSEPQSATGLVGNLDGGDMFIPQFSYCYYVAGNELKPVNSGSIILGNNAAYLSLDGVGEYVEGAGDVNRHIIRLMIDGGIADNITSAFADDAKECYDLTGRKLNAVRRAESLKKGVYIIGNRKIVR